MSRHLQKADGARGSLKWMLRSVNCRPDLLQPTVLPNLTWVSPLASDAHAEYRDGDALNRLGVHGLEGSLAQFWPRRGPQWDGLATFSGGLVLAEAKAHLAEFKSPASQAAGASAAKIAAAFQAVQGDLGLPERPWHSTYYQYANRIAHLWWLRQQGLDAHLLFIGFLGDTDMQGPDRPEQWRTAFEIADLALGLPKSHRLSPFIHHVFPLVKDL